MLATPELILKRRSANAWRRCFRAGATCRFTRRRWHAEDFSRLPLIGKTELRENFPANFLRAGQNLDALLSKQVC